MKCLHLAKEEFLEIVYTKEIIYSLGELITSIEQSKHYNEYDFSLPKVNA